MKINLHSIAVFTLLTTLLVQPSYCASQPSYKSGGDFFDYFFKEATPAPKGEFETKAEYEARLPKPWDKDTVVYLIAEPDLLDKLEAKAIGDDEPLCTHSYNTETKQLLLWVGSSMHASDLGFSRGKGCQEFLIHSNMTKGTAYEASNAYGAHATVTPETIELDFLFITNAQDFKGNGESGYGKKPSQFVFRLSKERDEAERLSKSAEIVLGIQIDSYDDKVAKVTFSDPPTIDNPTQSTITMRGIRCTLRSFELIDSSTGEVLASRDKP